MVPPTIHEIFQSMQPVPTDSSISFDDSSSMFPDVGTFNFEPDMDERLPLDMSNVGPSELEDWSTLPDYTDIG